MKVFQDYAYYYNMFYADKNYKKEAEQIDRLIRQYTVGNDKTILNLGCGTGNHDFELMELGYCVDGIDFSSNMIAIAKQKNVQNEYVVADVRNYRTNKKYDIAVSLFHVISYQNTNSDVVNTFITANKALELGKLFIFDVWYGPGVLRSLPTTRVKRVEDNEKIAVRYAAPCMHANTDIVDINYDVLIIDRKTEKVEQMQEVHHMRYFFTPEVEAFLQYGGFELVACLDCNTLSHPNYDSWTVYYIARKVKDIVD